MSMCVMCVTHPIRQLVLRELGEGFKLDACGWLHGRAPLQSTTAQDVLLTSWTLWICGLMTTVFQLTAVVLRKGLLFVFVQR